MKRYLSQFFMLVTVILAGANGSLAEAATITRTSAPFFPFDDGKTDGMYVAFSIYTPTAIADAWAKIDSFSGPISLGDNAPDTYHVGPMAAGSTTTVFFYIKTTATGDVSSPAGSSAIGHNISLWNGNPDTTGTSLQSDRFNFNDTTVNGNNFSALEDTIENSATKVRSVASGPSPATLGGTITITVNGETGNTSAPLSFTPASAAGWPAAAYKLVSSAISLPNGTTLNNQLYYDGNPGSGTYIGTYQFIAISPYTSTAITSPAQYLKFGGGLQHVPTDSAVINGFIPVVPPDSSNSVVVATTCTPAIVPAGTPASIACSISLINSGSTAITLDNIVDSLPTSPDNATYVTGSSAFNGAIVDDPQQTGNALTWSGQFPVPAGSTRNLTFTASIPDTPGTYLFTAIGHIGTTQIDTTAPLGDDAPATCVVVMTNAPTLTKAFTPTIVGPSSGAAVLTADLLFTISNQAGNPAQTGIDFSDTLPAGLTWAGTPTASQCGGTLTYGGAGNNIISFAGGSLGAGPSSCTITARVSSATPGLYQNSAGNIAGHPAWLNIDGVNATLQVAPAILTKDFVPNEILQGSTSGLNFTITNAPGSPAQTGLAFTDTLPAGLVLSGTATSPQCGGSVNYSGGNTISFTGGTLSAGQPSCTVTATVTSATTGIYTNGAANMSGLSVSLSNGVTDQTLTVNATPALGNMVFSPAAIGVGQQATLSFSITSISAKTEAVSFIETLPLGLSLAAPPNFTTSCGGALTRPGTATPVSGGEANFEFAGNIPKPAGAPVTCNYSVKVTGTGAGTYINNELNILNMTNLTNGVTNATLTIVAPTLGKLFGTNGITSGDSTTLTFTLANGALTPAQSGMAFIDTLPAGLSLSGAALSPQCGGTVSYSGGSTVSFSGGSLTAGTASCSIVTNVTSSTPGTYINGPGNLSGLSPGMVNGVTDQFLTVFAPLPSLTFLKASRINRDPVNDTTRPKAIPGAEVIYTMKVTNFGPGTAQSLVFTDPVPANTTLFVGNMGQGTPVRFIDGAIPSGFAASDVSVSFSAPADCNNYTHTPTVDADDYAADVCRIRVTMNNTKSMAADPDLTDSVGPDFSLEFKVRIN